MINVLGSKIYHFDGSIAGKVIDILFDSKGKIILIVLAKIIIPLLNIGIQRRFIPFDLVELMGMKYVIAVPSEMVKSFRKTLASPSTATLLERLEHRYRWFDALMITLLISIITLIIIVSFIFRTIGSITILIAVGLIMIAPVLLKDLLETSVPNCYSLQSILSSKVFDKWGALIGITKRVEIDFSKGVVREISIRKPFVIQSEYVNKLYERCDTIEIRVDLIKIAKRGRVELKISIKDLIGMVKKFGCKIDKR